MKTLFRIFALLGMMMAAASAGITEGEIGGAKYMIAAPEKWQGKLVLIAHGYRNADSPLDAGFDTKDAFSTGMLERGWAIASTSYRRNGWIVEDAILDLRALSDHVAKEHGKIDRCLLVGSSMGGLIGTLIAEGALDHVDGVVAIGAYLGNESRDGANGSLSFKPTAPILYLTNETELNHPQNYRKQEGGAKTALWEVKRPGHCNVSDIERLNAMLAVNDWVDGKAIEKERDGTVAPPVRESTATKVDGGLSGKITVVSESWGNLTTDLVGKDLETLGLKLGDKAVVKNGEKSLAVSVVRYWSEAKEGEAAIYVTPKGWVGIVTNGGRAVDSLGVKAGDTVVLGKAE
ncbi:SAM hydroxide adenosyltransferase [Luteolibacter luteus]|uniref:Serine aminopeptidase S33 domain-containing protein n=1 Tax=Luteolibacter luteus TaxID=2728835 RepID=A0A858RLA1_9BACT|nr:SAM hydroxide adenosyltransferase [Luteolibacter luteus]QJE96783.1 hypothetical protein HHL09_13650 [Luteolibacter luteus]